MLSVSSALVVLLASALASAQGTPEETVVAGEEVSTKPPLTGNPQIDYIWDPNLPRELNGFNMSSYPFLRSVPPPDKMDFKCDGLHDGFYASVPHKCQVYHHCLFGVRYDFLCANYTAFDQKNFICHFANEVDCINSPLFYDRNEALYKTTSTTTPEPPLIRARNPGRRTRPGPRRRRPFRPVYYDDFDDDYFQDYDEVPLYEDEEEAPSKANDADAEREEGAARPRPAGKRPAKNQANKSGDLFFNPNRPPPRIRPPVPNSEGSKKPAKAGKTTTTESPVEEEFEEEEEEEEVSTTTTTQAPKRPKAVGGRKAKPATTTTTTAAPEDEEYDEIEEEPEPPTTTTVRPRKVKTTTTARKVAKTTTTTTTTTTTEAPEEEVELPTKPNASLFNRRGPSILTQRRNGKQTTTTQAPEVEEEGEELEEVPEPTSTTTTTTPAPRRTSRPLRSRGPARQVAPAPQEEEAPEAPVKAPASRPAAAPRTQAPSAVEEADVQRAPASTRDPANRSRLRPVRPSARKVPEAPVEAVDEEVELEQEASELSVDETSRQGRQVPAPDDDSVDDTQDWSIINLFSRVIPQRS